MKLSLFLLALAIGTITCQQQAGGYKPIDQAQVLSDPQIQYLANYGAQSVAREAINVGDLPEGQYNISIIYGVSSQVVNGINYKFDVELVDLVGASSTRATYTVYYRAADNEHEVTSFTYEVGPGINGILIGDQDASDIDFSDNQALLGQSVVFGEEAFDLEWLGEAWLVGEDNLEDVPVLGGYSAVDLNEFNSNTQAQELLFFGLQDVISSVIKRGDLEDDYPFELTQINSVSRQVVSGVNYQYDVDIDNRNGTTGRLNFVVYDQPWTGTQKVISYNYTVTTQTVSQGPVVLSSTSESTVSADDLNDSDDSDEAGGYQQVDLTQAANDARIQSAQSEGAQYVAQQGIATGLLQNTPYQVSQTFGVSQQVVNGLNYKFDVELTNDQGARVRTQYVVYSPPANGQQIVTSYRFTT